MNWMPRTRGGLGVRFGAILPLHAADLNGSGAEVLFYSRLPHLQADYKCCHTKMKVKGLHVTKRYINECRNIFGGKS